jgi:hypothetical protein
VLVFVEKSLARELDCFDADSIARLESSPRHLLDDEGHGILGIGFGDDKSGTWRLIALADKAKHTRAKILPETSLE